MGDEISLIDLLVILLKFRKIIIGITVAAFCISIAGYFIYPAFRYKPREKAESPISELSLRKRGISKNEEILVQENRDEYFFVQGAVSGSIKASIMLVEPYVEPLKTQVYYKNAYKVRAIVFVLAAFFLSVFLAFLRNAIANIREDREAMEKIRGALGKIDKERR